MSPRPQIDHIRKPQILAAAAEVIAERGIGGTRISDVAERAGTSPSGVLYWFSSKEDLLTEALIRDEEAFNNALMLRLRKVERPEEKLVALIEACAEDSDWKLWMELWTRSMRDPGMSAARQELDDRWRALLARIIRAGIVSGAFSADVDPAAAAAALAAVIDGFAVQVTLGDELVDAEFMRRHVIELAEHLLGAELGAKAAGAGPGDRSGP